LRRWQGGLKGMRSVRPDRMHGGVFADARRAFKSGLFSDVALMLRVPFGAGPSHVMKLGPIGIAGDLDQPAQLRHDHIQALAKRVR